MSDVNHRQAARYGEIIELGAAPGFPIVVEIAVNNGPISGIAAGPDGTRLMVTNYGRDSVSVINTDNWRVTETVAGLNEPFAIAMGSHDSNRAYVSTVSTAYDSIAVIDLFTNAVIATHPVALSVSDLAVCPDGKYVYASRNGAGGADIADIAVLDTTTGDVEPIELTGVRKAPGTTTACVRLSADGSRLYVATNGPSGGQLVVIGTRPQSGDGRADGRMGRRRKSSTPRRGAGVIGTVEIGLPIRDVALSPNGAIAYVASCAPELGVVIDVVDTCTGKITGTRKIGEISGILTGLTLSGDGDRAYLISDDSITVLCTLTHDVIGTVAVANEPSCVVESPDARYLYIADYSGTVTVVPVASIVALGVENSAPESQDSAAWVMPQLPQHLEPALA